jgi:hypothetical protein
MDIFPVLPLQMQCFQTMHHQVVGLLSLSKVVQLDSMFIKNQPIPLTQALDEIVLEFVMPLLAPFQWGNVMIVFLWFPLHKLPLSVLVATF